MYPPPQMSVTTQRKPTRHGLHLVLTILTFGGWAISGWPIAWAWNTWGPRARTVTRNYR
jgi:hypothetical protein